MNEPNITVLLVDDHSLVRRGFRRMLEDDPAIRVVGEAEDGHQAVQLAAELKPQVVVMDFAMPSRNCVDTRSPKSGVSSISDSAKVRTSETLSATKRR